MEPDDKQGAVILGGGGDCCQTNRNASAGTFYEGAMVKGYPSDATFCSKPGNSGTGHSLQSFSYPDKYIRHYNFTAYIAGNGGPNTWDVTKPWSQDTSWLTASPWN